MCSCTESQFHKLCLEAEFDRSCKTNFRHHCILWGNRGFPFHDFVWTMSQPLFTQSTSNTCRKRLNNLEKRAIRALCLHESPDNGDYNSEHHRWSRSKSCRMVDHCDCFLRGERMPLKATTNLGKPHTAQSRLGGILDSGNCAAR